jgi:hypothetical protein
MNGIQVNIDDVWEFEKQVVPQQIIILFQILFVKLRTCTATTLAKKFIAIANQK